MNLVIAYALIRDGPALAEAGRLLDDPDPARTIERDLFRGSAEFVRLQPEEFGEMSLHAYRGLLAVGRLLDDPTLVHEALVRLDAFAERSEEHTSELQSRQYLVCRLLLGKKKHNPSAQTLRQ